MGDATALTSTPDPYTAKIAAEEDAYRLHRLRYLEADALASETVRRAFYTTMTDVELDATRRLDFVE